MSSEIQQWRQGRRITGDTTTIELSAECKGRRLAAIQFNKSNGNSFAHPRSRSSSSPAPVDLPMVMSRPYNEFKSDVSSRAEGEIQMLVYTVGMPVGTKDREFDAYTRLLAELGIDLSNSPRVPEPGTDRRHGSMPGKTRARPRDSQRNFAAGRGTQTGSSISSRSPLWNADPLHPWRLPPYQRETDIPTI